jgi:hypothetical protein
MGNVNCCDSIMLEGRNDSVFRPSTPGLARKPVPQCPIPARHHINRPEQNKPATRTSHLVPRDINCGGKPVLVQNAGVEPRAEASKPAQINNRIGCTLENGKRRVEIPLHFGTDDSPCRKREHIQNSEMAKLPDTDCANKTFDNSKWMHSKKFTSTNKHDPGPVSFSAQVLRFQDDSALFSCLSARISQRLAAREPFSISADNNSEPRTARDYMVRFIMAEAKVCSRPSTILRHRLLTCIPPSPQVTRPEAIKALEHHHFDAVEAVLALA